MASVVQIMFPRTVFQEQRRPTQAKKKTCRPTSARKKKCRSTSAKRKRRPLSAGAQETKFQCPEKEIHSNSENMGCNLGKTLRPMRNHLNILPLSSDIRLPTLAGLFPKNSKLFSKKNLTSEQNYRHFIDPKKLSYAESPLTVRGYDAIITECLEGTLKTLSRPLEALQTTAGLRTMQEALQTAKCYGFSGPHVEKAKMLLQIRPVVLKEKPEDNAVEGDMLSPPRVEHDCLICYQKATHRISEKCNKDHFYCKSCISRYIATTVENGKYPQHCPACSFEQSEGGRITETTLTSLAALGIITREMQYRYLVGQHREAKTSADFFLCPRKGCHKFLCNKNKKLLRSWEEKTMDGHFCTAMTKWARYKPGICPCGEFVCMQCKISLDPSEMDSHKCIIEKTSTSMDPETAAVVRKISRPCPNCNLLVTKNGGCDYMICGTSSHGRILDALRNGGCGFQFSWQTMKAVRTYYTGYNGERRDELMTKEYLKDAKEFYLKMGKKF